MTKTKQTFVTAAAAIVLICLWTPMASAQYMKREITLSASGGFQYPTGEFENLAKSGSGFRGEAGFFLSPSWAINLGAAYHRYDSETEAQAATGLTGVRYLSATATASLYLYPESWFTPYTTGGLGLYKGRRWFSPGGAEVIIDHSRLGLVGGFGLSAHKEGSRVSFFSDVIYHHIITDNGSSDQSVVWNTGIRISFGGRPF